MPGSQRTPPTCVDGGALLEVLVRVRTGDFTARMPADWTGVPGKVADLLNEVITSNQALEDELARLSRVVGQQGELSQRARLGGATSSWSGGLESVNDLIESLVRPTSEMQRVIGAVADGDLSKKVTADVRGEMLELKNTINAMVDQLNGLISEVSRVAREVGTEGKLGQAAAFTTEVGGVWRDLTDNVNLMAVNLTGQVRNIAEVTTAVANGDLSKTISIDVKGEFLELKNTVNAMVEQLKTFAAEVTRVAREVGVEGKLGGQAQSREVAGVWKDLTDNVNQLAANLTNQVRAIAEVATAVTEGDLTRQVRVEASGEVAVLKDKLNEMIRNLRETTRQNVEQDWLKTNRERLTRMLQGQDDLQAVSDMILSELAVLVGAQHGVFYTVANPADRGEDVLLELQAGYGYQERKHLATSFRLGEGLVGQCAKEAKRILLTDVPADYVRISSGLGEASPLNIIVLPISFEGSLRAVVELASFSRFSEVHQAFLDSITESLGIVLNTMRAAGLTEALLEQSQSQAAELRSQQEELRGSNEDLARQAQLLAEQNVVAVQKNLEVETSNRLIEEKVSQLAVSSKYKSEFIANMSHELRTPLNSLMILAQQLQENREHNLTETQVEYAGVIHSSGRELLELLNSILDLAKVESGTATAAVDDVDLDHLRGALLREYGPVAESKGLELTFELEPGTPERLVTDQQRLRQILKNLLANAFKFTEHGGVHVRVRPVHDGWDGEVATLTDAPGVLALSVTDSGIGVEVAEQERIFEAFAQGDGSTSRLYGGTGLGLSISRELAGLLGGSLTVDSVRGEGSTFTVHLPMGPGAPTAALGDPEPGAASPQGPEDRWLDGVRFLVVDDDPRNLFALTALLERGRAEVTSVTSGAAAIAALEATPAIDIVLTDIMMPDLDGYDTIRAIRGTEQHRAVAILAVTGKILPGERKRCMDAGADDYVPKPADQAELFTALRPWLPTEPRPRATRPGPRTVLEPAPERHAAAAGLSNALAGLKILVVDDDFRNIFAMTALLERGDAVVTVAESGAEALTALELAPDIDIVLMDIMMPVMDGYDTIRAIRGITTFATLPIVAVTGKAATGERQRCLDAGASDYIPKPIDVADLLHALTPWLPAARPAVGA